MLYTTLNNILEFVDCEDELEQLFTYLNKNEGDNEPLDFKTILEAVGIYNAILFLRTQKFEDYYKFVFRVAQSVLPIFENNYPEDKRPRLALEAAGKYIKGEISLKELEEAKADAWDAVNAANLSFTAYAAFSSYSAANSAFGSRGYYSASLAAVNAAADAKKQKWKEIEQIFIEECLS